MATGRGTSLSFYPFLNHYLLFLLAVLSVIGWFVAFIAQCVGEAQKDDLLRSITRTPLFGSLWFAIFLQLAVNAGIFIAIATDSLPLYQLQLTVFGAVALVFAVDGVNNIYAHDAPQQAVGAGWLILAIVDIIWILFLTSERPTLFNHLLNHPSISHGNQLVHPSGNRGFSGAAGVGGGYSSGKVNRSSSIAEMNPTNGANGGYYGTAGSGMGGGINSDQLRAENSPLVEMERNRNGETQSAMSTTGGTQPGGHIAKQAKALYAYQASPDDPQEISMSKGEIFDVLDNSGKWWQVAKTDGSGAVGIAPSNYLHLI